MSRICTPPYEAGYWSSMSENPRLTELYPRGGVFWAGGVAPLNVHKEVEKVAEAESKRSLVVLRDVRSISAAL